MSFLKPGNQAASGILRLKLTNLNNAVDTLIAIYSFNSLTGLIDLRTPNVKLFSNPTMDFFTLKNAEAVGSMRLYTLDGWEIARFVNEPSNTYSVAKQIVSNYVLSFEDKNGHMFQAVELQKR